MPVKLSLHVENHCIETVAKNVYTRLMDDYFTTDDVEGVLEEKIDLLRDFLEKSDFKKLRSSDPRLSGEVASEVVLTRDKKGGIDMVIK